MRGRGIRILEGKIRDDRRYKLGLKEISSWNEKPSPLRNTGLVRGHQRSDEFRSGWLQNTNIAIITVYEASNLRRGTVD